MYHSLPLLSLRGMRSRPETTVAATEAFPVRSAVPGALPLHPFHHELISGEEPGSGEDPVDHRALEFPSALILPGSRRRQAHQRALVHHTQAPPRPRRADMTSTGHRRRARCKVTIYCWNTTVRWPCALIAKLCVTVPIEN